jgi:hypothetical protein
MNIRWPEIISNEDLWKMTNQQSIAIQIKRRKWQWIGHAIRKPTGSIEKSVLDWNPQGARRRCRPKKTWKRTIEDEAMEAGKTWSEVKRLAVDRTRWRRFTDALCSRGSSSNYPER